MKKTIAENIFKNEGLIGINNLGNTCYLSSALQSILHCDQFIFDISSKDNEKKENNDPLYQQFIALIKHYFSLTDSNVINIETFWYELGKADNKYSNHNQHDTHEFISDFFYLLINRGCSTIKNLFFGENMYLSKCLRCNYIEKEKKEFLFLNLPIPKNIKPKLFLYCKFFSLENGFSERITIIVKKNELVKTIKSINKEIKFDIIKINHSSSLHTTLSDNDILFSQKINFKIDEVCLYQRSDKQDSINFFLYCITDIKNHDINIKHISNYLGYLDKEVNKTKLKMNYYPIKIALNKNLYICDLVKKIELFLNIPSEAINESIYGQVISSVFPNEYNNLFILLDKTSASHYFQPCDTETNKIERIEQVNIYDCLDEYYRTNKSKCKKCFQETETFTLVNNLPTYLLLYFDRFYLNIEYNKWIKNIEYIYYGKYLNLQKYLDETDNVNNYELISVNLHGGSFEDGHYWTESLVRDKWYSFDDNKVFPLSKFSISREALSLFYKYQLSQ